MDDHVATGTRAASNKHLYSRVFVYATDLELREQLLLPLLCAVVCIMRMLLKPDLELLCVFVYEAEAHLELRKELLLPLLGHLRVVQRVQQLLLRQHLVAIFVQVLSMKPALSIHTEAPDF